MDEIRSYDPSGRLVSITKSREDAAVPSESPKLAKTIRVVKTRANRWALIIDGVEFPYLISGNDAVSTEISPGRMPSVRFTLLADRVDVEWE